ncbi:RNA polymerase II-associated protein 1-like [Megalobrama amblycephala]|uniref:RNA polymerase II-associated protein 1-like n=1 Tax=Megalobrama amblycephala TaxID=75352 RepID=UPI0020147BFB|nr:RNA polymerase II-associated protein 1-like [Megalobrama amblycephala]XP_048047431.1 RNA polymerase II-associated protein 1-like [Megalobrama amblycephala]XP_048047432.1 RNA polymerase II-associated protein 1-like [Megalobrama amblycephala]
MLRRPKPTDSEADLLREQQELLAAGGQSTVTVVKRPDKRRGDAAAADAHEQEKQRDVVTIEDLPDEIPTLTPAKKSRFKQERVRFEDEDPEERLDRHDTHISAVLSRIIERDTSAVPVSLPCITGTAFPKVLRRSVVENEGQEKAPRGRKSIFARQIAAQRSLNGSDTRDKSSASRHVGCSPLESMETERPESDVMDRVGGPLLLSGQGLGIANSAMETMKIHEENQARLQAMSKSEILEEQRKLLAQLDPRLVDFVRSRKAQRTPGSESSSSPVQRLPNSTSTELDHTIKAQESQRDTMEDDEEEDENQLVVQPPITGK